MKSITVPVTLAKDQEIEIEIGYVSQGLDKWFYKFGDSVSSVKNFSLNMATDFRNIDFPENTISPSTKEKTATGWKLNWNFKNLISGFHIGMDMPNKLNPGPLASRISFFAPVSLIFFFFVVFMISVIKDIKIHPMNYFFIAAAFFAFHLLFSYTVDHLDIYLAFLISSVVSMFLVISYMRIVVGARFAAIEVGISQFIFLILFSLAHFFEGYTGLTVTVGGIFTLGVMMRLTAKINWEEKFKSSRETSRGTD
ncbi:MAG: inner membrane CreD family protein [Patescibacteria group bacterium]